MRIIGGEKRGLRLRSVTGVTTRPTADRVKEALFNILAGEIVEAAVLDLFAGSGALGLEALSRGAARAVFVEKDRKAGAVLRSNVQAAGFGRQASVVLADVFRTLTRPEKLGGPFDVVFADPPYMREMAGTVVGAVAESGVLAPSGLLVVEHDRREELPPRWENIVQIRAARYGDTTLSFYRGGGARGNSPLSGQL